MSFEWEDRHVSGDAIRVTQAKTGAQLAIPMHSELKAVLEILPKDGLTFLTTQYGKPFKDSASFRKPVPRVVR